MSHRFTRENIAFDADGAVLRGWLYRPTTTGAAPVVVMAHGWSLVKEAYLDRYAEAFASAGLAVLVYDHRGFGDSDGGPRQEIDPWRQIEDCRHAITFATFLDSIDPARIGLWGTSYSAAHALQVAATDRRVKAVVAQVPGATATACAAAATSGPRHCRRHSRPTASRFCAAASVPPAR